MFQMDNDILQSLYVTKSTTTIKTYKLNLISPMAMHGAHLNKPEIKPSSIKGIMRYWWRAIQREANYRTLLEKESEYFGGVNPSTKKSPITITTSNLNLEESSTNLLPHRPKKGQKGLYRATFKQDGNFEVSLILPPNKRESALDMYLNLFELVTLVGSFGQRARRGFGSVQLAHTTLQSVDSYVDRIIKLLKAFGHSPQKLKHVIALSEQKPENRPCLRNVYWGTQFSSVQKVLSRIGEASSKYNRDGALGSISSRGEQTDKLASPLWCSIKKIDDAYIPIIGELVSSETKRRTTYEINKKRFLHYLGVNID